MRSKHVQKPVVQKTPVTPREFPTLSVWSPGYVALLASLGCAAFLLVFYLYHIRPFLQLPADILMFAESNFVGDIIKWRTGTPLYTPPGDSNSLVYTPGATLLTYTLAWLSGHPTSIVAFRLIQVGFVFSAALLGAVCCRMLYRRAYPGQALPYPTTWFLLTFAALALAATSPRINRYAHCLHADALALLVSLACFWAILWYLQAPSWQRLLLMAALPALGWFTKQFLLIWAVITFLILLLDDPTNLKRLIAYTIATTIGVALAVGGCYLLWGEPFIFWVFKVVGGSRKNIGWSSAGYNLSLARSIDHTLRAWPEIATGFVGAYLFLRGQTLRTLGPLWLGWAVLIVTEGLTSGVGWNVLYHFGPGVLIGMIWTLAALPHFWPSQVPQLETPWPRGVLCLRAAGAVLGIFTLFVALRVTPTGDQIEARFWRGRGPLTDVQRYITAIEHEFIGLPAEKVLLDVGNWVYLPSAVVAKDRANSLADQPIIGLYDNFTPFLERIRTQAYAKILVRDLHTPFFLYDWAEWPRSSGVKQALSTYYTEIRTIPAPEEKTQLPPTIQHAGTVSVLVPKTLQP